MQVQQRRQLQPRQGLVAWAIPSFGRALADRQLGDLQPRRPFVIEPKGRIQFRRRQEVTAWAGCASAFLSGTSALAPGRAGMGHASERVTAVVLFKKER